jgi:hypothetical protein
LRTYIFTEKERRAIRSVLNGESVAGFRRIRYRIKTFERLADDVSLYLKARELVTTAAT